MRIILIAAVLIIAVTAVCFVLKKKIGSRFMDGFVKGTEQIGYGGDPVEFEHFTLTETGTAIQSYVLEAWKTQDGAQLDYYVSFPDLKAETDNREEIRRMIRSVKGDEAFYRELCAVIGNCRIRKWDGFKGDNPPGILDGSSMSFEAVLSDGTKISAYGMNNFPGNYGRLSGTLRDMAAIQLIDSTDFRAECFSAVLPESWVGKVSARFSETLVAFTVPLNDGNELTFFIIDNDSYGYNSEYYEDSVDVGRLVSENGKDVRFVTARNHSPISGYTEKVSEDALKLWETFETDRISVIDSITGINGYELYPEDGTILYESVARNLIDEAKGLWINLNFAGEYPGMATFVKIDGREYRPMFPANQNVTSVEKVRARFLRVFSEEFTDKVLNEAIARKDLIEKDGTVYSAAKKIKGTGAVNFWFDSVRNEGNGKFSVVMSVRKDSGTCCIDFPAEKNNEGDFVFTDFPYWEEAE